MGLAHLFYGSMLENTLIAALALVFIFEGLLPFVFPNVWRKMMLEAANLSEKQLRLMGLTAIIFGMIVLLFVS